MVDPYQPTRRKDVKWPPAEHNAFHQHKAEAMRRRKRVRKATLLMHKKERILARSARPS